MAFEVNLIASAKKDLFEAIEYYGKINHALAERFYSEFLELNSFLHANPHLALKYKYIRTYKLRSFPYVVHFVINDEAQIVTIIAIIFGKQEKTDFSNRFPDLQ